MPQITMLLWFSLCKELLLEQFIVTSSDGWGCKLSGEKWDRCIPDGLSFAKVFMGQQ